MDFLKKMLAGKSKTVFDRSSSDPSLNPNYSNPVPNPQAVRSLKPIPRSEWSQRDQQMDILKRNTKNGKYSSGKGVGY